MPANGSSPDTPAAAAPPTAATPRDDRSAKFVGYGLFALILTLVVSLFLLTGATISPPGKTTPGTTDLFLFSYRLAPDQVLLLAVLVGGALGGCVHVATSFSDYVGNARYRAAWQWWYLLRPFIGGCLATAFYFLIRGGVMSMAGGADNSPPNLHGMIAISFLVGMFSKQATDKLDDVFDTLFKTDKDIARSAGLETAAPVLNAVVPESVEAGSGDTRLVLAGASFAAGSQVRVNGAARDADSVKANVVEVTLKADELATPTVTPIKLAVAAPGGAVSNEVEFVVADRRQLPGTPDDRGSTPGETQPEEAMPGQVTIDISKATIPGAADPASTSGDGQAPAPGPDAEGEADAGQEPATVTADATPPAESAAESGEQDPAGEGTGPKG